MNFDFLLYNSASLNVIEIHYGFWYLIIITVFLLLLLFLK